MEEIRYCPMCGAYIPHLADKCLACGWSVKKQKTDDTTIDIDIDRVVKKHYLTVNLGGERLLCYIGKADVEMCDIVSSGRDMSGKFARTAPRIAKIYMTLIAC